MEKQAAVRAIAQFSVCTQPWNTYIKAMGKQDDTPFPTKEHPKPMYRGYQIGFEEFDTAARVQYHYRKYPDERIFASLSRWRKGDLLGDLSFQQFRNVQPHSVHREDPNGLNLVPQENYLKLNYKNPGMVGRYLSRTGHLYSQDILPMHPIAYLLLKQAKGRATKLGLFPRQGNPFWHRSQQYRPKPLADGGKYNPADAKTGDTIRYYAYHWMQNEKVRNYFKNLDSAATAKKGAGSVGRGEFNQQGSETEDAKFVQVSDLYGDVGAPKDITYSVKKPHTNEGPSTVGLRKPLNLYGGKDGAKKRTGGPNPLGFKKV